MTAMAAVFVAVHLHSLTPERRKAPQVCPSLRVRPSWRRVNRVHKETRTGFGTLSLQLAEIARDLRLGLATLTDPRAAKW